MENPINDILSGICCELCGTYFDHPQYPKEYFSHGYPVVCHDCWRDLSEDERKKHIRAEKDVR
jgi:hypothetical protein